MCGPRLYEKLEAFVCGQPRAGHARPLPHDDKKAQKAAAMRFLHSCGFIYSFMRSHIRRHGHGTVVADVQDVAAAFAEAAVDGGLVGVQQVNGHKRLNSAGKAAALQTPRAAAIQHALAQGQATGTPCSFGFLML